MPWSQDLPRVWVDAMLTKDIAASSFQCLAEHAMAAGADDAPVTAELRFAR